VRTIVCKAKLTDKQADELGGVFLNESHYDVLIRGESVRGLREDGSTLFVIVKNHIKPSLCVTARNALRLAARVSNNRGTAAGNVTKQDVLRLNQEIAEKGGKSFYTVTKTGMLTKVLQDGTISKTSYAKPVESGIAGFFDRSPRNPYCRLTSYNAEHADKFQSAVPFIQAVNSAFKEQEPVRYESQMKMIRETNRDFVIPDTAFTTITVNRNFRTACHKDAGDYHDGFGVLSVLQTGKYHGGFFVIPKYRVAVDLRTTDVLLADVHEWHGNTEITPITENWERISCVFYYREKMHECGSAAEELETAKRFRKI